MAKEAQEALFNIYYKSSEHLDFLLTKDSATAQQIELARKSMSTALQAICERGWLGDYQAWYMGMGE